jgi:thiol peroxidase
MVPAFTVVSSALAEMTPNDLAGKRVVYNIFPSVDTPTCATSVRKFNELAAGMADTVVLCVSADLPFAQNRFCGAEGLSNVQTASTFRGNFGEAFGVALRDGAFAGLLARAVVVTDASGMVLHTELVPEIGSEPDYEAAISALA